MKLPLFLLSLLTFPAFAQHGKGIRIAWKIARNDSLKYSVTMNDIGESSIKTPFDMLINSMSDSTNKSAVSGQILFEKLHQAYRNQQYTATLTGQGNIVSVLMSVKTAKGKSEPDTARSFSPFLSSAYQNIGLRGSVYKTGGIHSFWLKNSQKNLLALMFELPQVPVQVGDKWPLDINLIEFDQNFICDSSSRSNEVTVVAIKKIEIDRAFVLQYNVLEYAKGVMSYPFFGSSGSKQESMMRASYQGTGEFSLNQGRWITFNGVMSLESTGLVTSNKKTKFALVQITK